MTGQSVLLNFINHCQISQCDDALQEQVKKCFIDASMVLCAGTRNESSRKVASFARQTFPGNEATILATGEKAGLIGAVVANAMAANALDLDDGFSLIMGHPGAGLIGGLLSASEMIDCTYGEFLSALLVGYEICIRQGLCMQDYYSFYHSTGSYAAMGTAAAVGKLLKLSNEELMNAMGIADYYGPLVPCMRTVRTPSLNKDGIYLGAQTGVEAVLLAKAGIDGKAMILLDDSYRSYIDSLNRKFYIFDVYFKFFSCCRWAQGALTAVKKMQIPADISCIKNIFVYSYNASGELFSGLPQNETEAQYNLRYPLASYLINGDFGPNESSLHIDNSERMQALMDKIIFITDPEYERMFPEKRYTRVVIKIDDGQIIDSGPTEPAGDHGSDVPMNEIIQKCIHFNSIFHAPEKINKAIHEILSADYDAKFSGLRSYIAELAKVN